MLSRTSGGLVFLAGVLLFAGRILAAGEPTAPAIKDAARDDTGRVWGISENGPGPGLYAFDGSGGWQRIASPGIGKDARPCSLGRRADGTVVCVWLLDGNRYQWSAHRGPDSTLGRAFSMGEGRYPHDYRLTSDFKSNLWLTQAGPDIYRLPPDGPVECVHSITSEECLPGTLEGGVTSHYWPTVAALADADGRMWFWTDHADGGSNGATIRGALVYDGEKFVQHDFLLPDGGPQKSLTALARKDGQHLWFARFFDGLYTLDTATFRAERVPDQPKEASMTTLAAACNCGNWYFIMGQNRPEGGGGTLWRLGGNGKWEKLIDGVDASYSFNHQLDRVWNATDRGEYLGSNGNGLWFLPGDGSAPRRADWRQGFPLATPHRFIDLQNGRWLGISTTGVTWVGSPDALWAERTAPENGRIRTLRAGSTLRIDGRGHLWGMFTTNSRVLHGWDGESWTEHPLPAELGANSYMRLFNIDARGRVWLLSGTQKKQAALYDPPTDGWQVFADFDAALEAQNGSHDAEFPPEEERFNLPRFGPEGRICYLSEQWKVVVHADHAWRRWSRGEITGQQGNFAFDGAPFINRAGRVSINVDRKTWEFIEGNGWHTVAFEPGFADNDRFFSARQWKPPAGSKPPFQPDSAVRDNQGVWWLTWQRGLYKFREGRWTSVLKADEPQPFSDGRRLGAVLIDARGNAFLSNGNNQGEYVILAPTGPPPHTAVSKAPADEASSPAATNERITVGLTTDASAFDGKVHFDWRLDGGPWTALGAERAAATVTLENLPGGSHRFEARSFDAALQTDAVPAGLDFEVHVDAQAQITGYLAQLDDPDYARRDLAVAALARQPALARPALEQARSAADEAGRWWIDAALQKIEAAERATSSQLGSRPIKGN